MNGIILVQLNNLDILKDNIGAYYIEQQNRIANYYIQCGLVNSYSDFKRSIDGLYIDGQKLKDFLKEEYLKNLTEEEIIKDYFFVQNRSTILGKGKNGNIRLIINNII